MAEESQQFEMRVEQVLMQGVEAMDRQTTREGKELHYEYKDYIKNGIERCR
jgi:hypothetical protein